MYQKIMKYITTTNIASLRGKPQYDKYSNADKYFNPILGLHFSLYVLNKLSLGDICF
jgi:hypothetical protein